MVSSPEQPLPTVGPIAQRDLGPQATMEEFHYSYCLYCSQCPYRFNSLNVGEWDWVEFHSEGQMI